MKKIFSFCLILATCVGLTGGSPLSVQDNLVYPPTVSLEEIRERIDRVDPGHPRLLATKADFENMRRSLEENALRRSLADAVLEQAKALQDIAPIKREKEGRRLLGQSRRCLKRLIILAMAYQISGDQDHVRRAEQEMLAVSRFTDWNPDHFLDVAEMTLALAIGYDWLFEELGESSRREIRTAMVEKSISLPFETRHNRWIRSTNNWGQVCHGGLTGGALAIVEHEPDLAARTVHNALHNVTYSMKAYSPKGSYPEGPGYWAYGTTYNVLLIDILEGVFGNDFGLNGAPGFNQTGQYLSLVTGPSGLFFNYADGGARRGLQPTLFWFASRYQQPDWLLGEEDRLWDTLSRLQTQDARSQSDRFLPLTLLWYEDWGKIQDVALPLHWRGDGDTPVTVHRSSRGPGATFVGLKAGSPSANHGQMDIGSFVLDAGGIRWAIDLGAEGYHGIESRGMNLWNRDQDSDRWTIFRQSNHGHNTLVIDGKLQQAAGKGTIIQFSSNVDFPHSVIDMSSVYEGQAGEVQRGIALVNSRDVLIQDYLSGLKPGSRVRWGMITRGETTAIKGNKLSLRQEGSQITLEILAPANSTWQAVDTVNPRNEWDSPNPGTRGIVFEAVAPASGELLLAVVARPGAGSGSPVRLRSFEEWGE